MTTSTELINRALDHAIDKDPATLKLIIDLVVEYKIAVNQANKIERTLHAMIKDGETVAGFRRMDRVQDMGLFTDTDKNGQTYQQDKWQGSGHACTFSTGEATGEGQRGTE